MEFWRREHFFLGSGWWRAQVAAFPQQNWHGWSFVDISCWHFYRQKNTHLFSTAQNHVWINSLQADLVTYPHPAGTNLSRWFSGFSCLVKSLQILEGIFKAWRILRWIFPSKKNEAYILKTPYLFTNGIHFRRKNTPRPSSMRIGEGPSRGRNMVFTPFWGVLYSLRRRGLQKRGSIFVGVGIKLDEKTYMVIFEGFLMISPHCFGLVQKYPPWN